jgi:hypothetical protein
MLHWVTSKDSSTSSSNDINSHSRTVEGAPSGSIKTRLSKFTRSAKKEETPDWQWQLGSITTKIEVGSMEDRSEIDNDHGIESSKGGINVKVGHTVVVERDMASNLSSTPSTKRTNTRNSEFEDIEQIAGLGSRSVHKSTEDLVERDVTFSV